MRVIDVDSHFLEPVDWLVQVDPKLAEAIPPTDPIRRIVQNVVGDLLAVVPSSQRPKNLLELLAPSGRRSLEAMLEQNRDESQPLLEDAPSSYDAEARLAFCDEKGIDIQFLNSTLGSEPFAAAMRAGDPELARRGLAAFNTWATQTLAPHIDRLIPIALIDVRDVDWAVAEITRMRQAGSRAFQVRAEPVSETKSLAHPDLDPIWATAADLGMAVVFHIGAGRGELKRGWYFNGGDPSNFALLHLVGGAMVPQVALAAMLIEGVFERHPGLVVMVQELGIGWLPHFMETVDSITVG
jgi:predicted TIM-barrel fold metal-dependent hydrolase